MGQRWTDEEIGGALSLKYEDFCRRYPHRSYAAWASMRYLTRKSADEVEQEDFGSPLSKLSKEARAYCDDLASGLGLDDLIERCARPGERREHTDERPTPALPLPADKPLVRYLGHEMEETASDEDLMNALIAWQDVRNRAIQQTLEHRVDIPVRDGKPIAIAFPSDWHIGNAGTDHKRIIEDNKLIMAHPRLYCALGGDPVDNFIIEKMISASRSQVAQVDVQWRLFRYLVQQLTDSNSLLFVGAGNHDAWTHKVAGLDGINAALRGIPVVNTGEGGFITVKVGATSYGIYRKHKPTRFNSKQNPTHFLKQMLRMGTPWDFDIGVSEHFHDCNIEQGEFRPGTGAHRVFITTGSYKVKDEYSESLGYYGGGYGVPCVVLFPDRKEMLPVMKIEQAIRIVDAY